MTTTTAAKPTVTAPKTPAKVKYVAPTGAELVAAVAKLKTRYVAADKGETTARGLFEAADIALQNSRVSKVRVAFEAAMLTPNQGKPNLLAATRYLLLTDEELKATPAKIKATASSRKNTLRNYVDAGAALLEAGLVSRTGEADAEERAIVAAVFREGNRRDKADAKAAKNGGGETPERQAEKLEAAEAPEALTFTTLAGMVATMNRTLDIMAAGDVVISEQEAAAMADMLAGFQSKLSAYAEGK